MLFRSVGAEPQRRQQLERLEVLRRRAAPTAERHPPGAQPARPVDLGEPAEGRAEGLRAVPRRGLVRGAVVQDAVVDLVGEEHERVALGVAGESARSQRALA